MTIEQLRELRSAYKEIRQLSERIAELESMRVSPRATAYGAERVQTSPKGDVQPDNIARMDDLLGKYNSALESALSLTNEFEEALKMLNSRERRIMRMYYIDGMTWEKVCVEMNLSWTPLHYARRNALAIMCPDYKDKRQREYQK